MGGLCVRRDIEGMMKEEKGWGAGEELVKAAKDRAHAKPIEQGLNSKGEKSQTRV
jgi:hypothetical protein